MSSEKNAPARSGMEYAGALLLLLLLLSACRSDDKKPAEQIEADTIVTPAAGPLFLSKEGDFSVQLPFGFALPERAPFVVKGRPGGVVYTSEAGEHAVMLAFTNIPGEGTDGGKGEFDAARDTALRTVGGTLVHEKDLQYDGHPGRSIYLTLPLPSGTTALGRIDLYLIEGRLYQLFYLSPTREDFNSPDVAAYFDSFTLRK